MARLPLGAIYRGVNPVLLKQQQGIWRFGLKNDKWIAKFLIYVYLLAESVTCLTANVNQDETKQVKHMDDSTCFTCINMQSLQTSNLNRARLNHYQAS